MGAYENPPMITFRTSGAGEAWANAAASFGKNIGDAITARSRKLEADLEKEQKEMLNIAKQRVQLEAKGAEDIKNELNKMEGLDEAFKTAYQKEYNEGWKAYTISQTSTDVNEIESLQPTLKKFNHFKINGGEQIQLANDFIIGLGKGVDEITSDGPGIPGTVDMFYPGNVNYMKAGNIEAGGIETDKGEERTVDIDEKGNAVISYKLAKEDGGLETFNINMGEIDLETVFKVPDARSILEGKISKSGIFVGEGKDKTLSTEYLPMDPATGKPKMETFSEVFTDKDSGKQMLRIKRGPAIKANDIVQIYTDQMLSAKLSDDQKVSIWKNTLNGQIKEVEIGTGKIGADGKEIMEKVPFNVADLNFNKDGATTLTPYEQKLYTAAISQFAGTQANNDIQAISEGLGGDEKLINMPTESLSNSYKNTRAAFKRMIDGEDANLALSTNTYIAKDDSGKWNVFTIGNLGVPMPRFTTEIDGEQIASGVDNVADLVTLIPGIDHEKLKKELGKNNLP